MLCNKCRNEGEGKHIIMLWIVSCASFLGSVPRCDAHGTFMRMLEPFGWIILAQGPSMCLLRTLVEPTHYAQSLCVLSFTPFLFGPPRLQRQSSALHLFIHLHRIHLTHPHLTYDRNAPQKNSIYNLPNFAKCDESKNDDKRRHRPTHLLYLS